MSSKYLLDNDGYAVIQIDFGFPAPEKKKKAKAKAKVKKGKPKVELKKTDAPKEVEQKKETSKEDVKKEEPIKDIIKEVVTNKPSKEPIKDEPPKESIKEDESPQTDPIVTEPQPSDIEVYIPDIDDVDLIGEPDDVLEIVTLPPPKAPVPIQPLQLSKIIEEPQTDLASPSVVDDTTPPAPPSPPPETLILKIWVDYESTTRVSTLIEVSPRLTLTELKTKLGGIFSVNPDKVNLYHLVYISSFTIGDIRHKDGRNGRLLSGESRTLSDIGLKKAANIEMIVGRV